MLAEYAHYTVFDGTCPTMLRLFMVWRSGTMGYTRLMRDGYFCVHRFMATIYSTIQARTVPARRDITVEHLLYVLIAVASVFLHLTLLGTRALHHDETLHAEYSWRLYQGQGYAHDPLLHGPFLYYWTAFVYLLFGASDTTARLSAALFGMVAVLLPVLLRRELGRAAALLASAYLLISPVFLYVGRFIRHDMFAVTFELLAVIALVRYVRSERSVWHYVFAASMGLMLATMETFYLFLLILGAYVVVVLLWEIAPKLLWWLAGYVAVAGFAIKVVPLVAGAIPLVTESQALDVRHQPDNQWGVYFSKVGAVVGPMLAHPATLLLLAATLGLAVVLWWSLWGNKDASGRSAWRRAAARSAPGSLLGAVDRVPGLQWLWAHLIAFAIYAVFYMALLSSPGQPNTTGIVTGVLGSFLYWLGQHGVRRGGQPPHYYLFQLSVYEPLVLIFGSAGILLVARDLVRRLRSERRQSTTVIDSTNDGSDTRRLAHLLPLFLPGLLAWWSIAALAIYSWAGEKMPWLTIHVVLPWALLGAWALARLWRWALGPDGLRSITWPTWALSAMAFALIVPSLILLTLTSADADRVNQVWFWPLLISLALVFQVAGTALLAGRRQALFALIGVVLVLLVPFTVRSSVRLSYVNGDVPLEPLVFVQTSPDVARAMDDLRRASLLQGSREQIGIRYDNETVWQWYLRDYTNTEGSGGQILNGIDEDVQVIFMLAENVSANEDELDGFVQQRYPLRWWLPECEVYRFPTSDPECGPNPEGTSIIGNFVRRPWDGAAIADLWQFWIYRRMPAPLGSSDWILLVRPDIAYQFGLSGELDS
jgi:uncharacterized protein (TIGR03663 family)